MSEEKGGILNGWHLRKEFHVGNFAMLFLWIVSGVWWLSAIDSTQKQHGKDLARESIERKAADKEERQARRDADERLRLQTDARFTRMSQRISIDFAEVKTLLREINNKLDRKADK